MNGIRLITLDLDDTLWPCGPVIQAAEHSLYGWLQQHAPRVAAGHDILSLREHRKLLAAAQPELAHDLTALRLVQLQQLMREHGQEPALAQAASDHFRTARNRVSPYPDVAVALSMLRDAYLLVSLTNGNAQPEHTPLAGCFHHSLSAGEVGAAKPDPALFLAACGWAGVTPQQALHVGDDPWRDVAPARALGMTTVWINRSGAIWPSELAPPDLQFTDLAALTATLLAQPEDALT